jgi:SWI/SNF-related matrix-associated actin-dependent regulator of chromatin subfamily B member 1
MKYAVVNTETGKPVNPAPPPGTPLPDDVQYMHLPRIRCLDCPGKLYTPGPETTVGNFEVHLKNKQHLENVKARLKASRAASASGSRSGTTGNSGS